MKITNIYSKQGRKYTSDKDSPALAVFIEKQLQDRDLKCADLSKKTGIPTPTLSELMNGKRRFSTCSIVRIALALSLDVYEMARIQSDEIVSEYIKSTFKKDRDEI